MTGTAMIIDGQRSKRVVLVKDGTAEVTERECTGCRTVKPLEEFYRSKSGPFGRQSRCKDCANGATRNSREKGGEARLVERRAADRLRYQDPVRRRQKLNWEFKRRYGITLDDFAATVEAQDGLCMICQRRPAGEGNHGTLFQDHCHVTDLLRDALCGPCNSGLGMFGESAERLRAAADYLDQWSVIHAAQEAV